MGNIFMRIREFMTGRNGIDNLNKALAVVYIVILCIKTLLQFILVPFTASGKSTLIPYIAVSAVQYLLLAYMLFRALSKNLQKRYNENFKFEQVFKAWKPYIERLKLRFRYRKTHKFRTCKKCGEFLRLKKGKGKREVVCPKCGAELKFYL